MSMMRRMGVAGLLGLLAVLPATAQTGIGVRTLSVGATPALPSGTTVRLDGLGTSGGTNVLFVDGDGDVFERLLAVTDIPSAFTRDDVAETITQPWTWSASVPQVRWYESDQSANERQWIALANDKAWMLRAYTDDGGSSAPILTALRGTGTAMTSLTLHPRTYIVEHLYPTVGYTSDIATPSAKMRAINAAELFIETIVAQERITTMGGRFTVTPSNVLTRDIDGSTTTVCVKYNSFLLHVGGVEYGSKIVLEKAGQFEAMHVTSTSTPTVDGTYGDYCYTVSRNRDGSGANSWVAGDGIIDTGKTGSGMIDQFAVRGLTASTIEGPSIDFLVRTGDTWNALAHRASVGNLNGRYGYSGDTWGLAAGDPSATYITAEATNGFRIIGPSNTVKFHAKTNGDIDILGSIAVGSGGHIKGGATAYNTGTGFWMGDDGGTYKLRIGTTTAGSHYLAWSGSSLLIAGTITATGDLYVNGDIVSPSGNATLSITNSTPVTGKIRLSAPGGLDVLIGGNSGSGVTGTKTVRASGGASDCTLVFIAGILTGGTC